MNTASSILVTSLLKIGFFVVLEFLIPVSGWAPDPTGAGTSLLLHLGLVLCGDVLNVFCNNVEINTVP